VTSLPLALPAGATLRQYAESLQAAGIRVLPGSQGTFWAGAADRVLWRLPIFHVGAPSSPEVDDALRRTRAIVASYLVEPDAQNAANAWLYLCSDRDYALGTRVPAMRRNVRRAMRDFQSELTSIPGVGEKLKARLLRNFGSLKRVSEASFAELKPFVGERQAQRIVEHFAALKGRANDEPEEGD
jgi:hypothetical protein